MRILRKLRQGWIWLNKPQVTKTRAKRQTYIPDDQHLKWRIGEAKDGAYFECQADNLFDCFFSLRKMMRKFKKTGEW